jgi:hypothetical protein
MSQQRHRERENIPATYDTAEVTRSYDTDLSYGPYLVAADSESIDDFVTRHYLRKIREGVIINNPCHYERSKVSQASYPGSASGVRFSDGKHWEATGAVTEWVMSENPQFLASPPDPSLDNSKSLDRARLVALSNIDKTPYAFGEDIGELGETIEFLRRPMFSMVHLAKRFRKDVLKRLSAKKALYHAQAVASVWLEYRFAFQPLVQSSWNLVESFSKKRDALPPRRSAHGRSTVQGSQSSTSSATSRYGFTQTKTVNVEHKASILYEVTNPVTGWRHTYGLRGKDIPTTLWQLLPLSFMVDRVYDVSSFCRAIINLADPRVSILAGSTTTKTDSVYTVQLVSQYASGWTYNTNGNVHIVDNFTYDRQLWYPSIFDTVPDFTPGYLVGDALKIADLGSLIIQNIRAR